LQGQDLEQVGTLHLYLTPVLDAVTVPVTRMLPLPVSHRNNVKKMENKKPNLTLTFSYFLTSFPDETGRSS